MKLKKFNEYSIEQRVIAGIFFTALILLWLADDRNEFLSMANTMANIVLALVALYAINSWKKEHSAKKRAEVAIDFGELAFEVTSALARVTDTIAFGSDIPQRDENSFDDFTDLIFHKFNKETTLFNELLAKRFRFGQILGADCEQLIQDIKALISHVSVKAREYRRLAKRVHDREQMQKNKTSFHIASPEDDEMEAKHKERYERMTALEDELIYIDGYYMFDQIEMLRSRIDDFVKTHQL